MQSLTERIIDSNQTDRVLNDMQLKRMLGGGDASRYGLVNRSLKTGELHRLKRGLYILDSKYREHRLHPFTISQSFIPSSYVSFETALANHGWIPEAVYQTASVTPLSKSKEYSIEGFGILSFRPLAIQQGYFLELVERVQINNQTMLVAKPLRALMDLVCIRKQEWLGLGWLIEGLRIEEGVLNAISKTDIKILKLIYKQKRVQTFIEHLAKDLAK